VAIQVINRKTRVRKFIAYDLEWIPGTPTRDNPSRLEQVRMVGLYDGQQYRCYKDVRDFLRNELNSENRGKWFYAHAGGLADVQFVLEEVIKINREKGHQVFEVQASFSGSSAIIVHVKFKNSKNVYHFIDSFWLMRTSLEKIGKWLGMAKSNKEERMTRKAAREFYTNVDYEKLRSYNEQDCRILWHAISQFENVLLDMGSQLQMTQASSAMQLFRRKYLQQDIPTSNKVNEMARRSYVASRVEVFNAECDEANYYDVNSSFPYAMVFPCPGRLRKTNTTLGDEDGLFIADVEVEVPEAYITPTPMRGADGRVFFPTGRWRQWFTSVDLHLLMEEGGIVHNVREVMHFDPMDDLAQYARDVYAKRKGTSGFESEVYKIMANSLYGKFAESPDKQSLCIDPPREVMERMKQKASKEGGDYEEQELMPGIWLVENSVAVPHMHVPISTHITAFARRTLYRLLSYCSDYYYCDTDGFCTNDTLQTGPDLGQIKLEKHVRKGQFVQPKLYRLEGTDDKGKELGAKYNDKGEILPELDEDTGEPLLDAMGRPLFSGLIKAKGFSHLNVNQFMGLLEGEAVSFERMSRLRDQFRHQRITPQEEVVEKRLQGTLLPKRFTYPDGHTRPWTVEELESGTTLPADLRFRG